MDNGERKSYRLEVFWGAVPGILASAAPHRSGFPAEETGFIDQCNGVHCVFRGRREMEM